MRGFDSMKRPVAVVLFVVILLTSFTQLNDSFSFAQSKKSARDLRQGDTFCLGRWPQTRVTDYDFLSQLDSIAAKLYSYEYKYLDENSTERFLKMSFGDVKLGSNVYRKVVIQQYRPSLVNQNTSADNTYQDDNGYYTGNTYWFRWEPIQWRVLNVSKEGADVIADQIIDSQPFNAVGKGLNWESSSIREWLHKYFYLSAFSDNEKKLILNTTHQDTSKIGNNAVNNAKAVSDRIWLLTYDDSVNRSYGFLDSPSKSDESRLAVGTDYAKAQGLHVKNNISKYVYSDWLLRSSGYYTGHITGISNTGSVNYNISEQYTDRGIRPAFKLSFSSVVGSSADPVELNRIVKSCFAGHTYKNVITNATITKNGFITKKCVLCGSIGGKTYIYRPHTITLKANKYVYTGNTVTPAVVVKDTAGKTIASKYYTLTYAKGRKNVGRYAIKVTFKGYYSGSVMRYFDIIPKPSQVLTIKNYEKKQFVITWQQVARITGYQIQTAQSKDFKKGLKTVTAKSYSKNGRFRSYIKSKTIYFVRIRTYKMVKFGSSMIPLYSAWSKAKVTKTS